MSVSLAIELVLPGKVRVITAALGYNGGQEEEEDGLNILVTTNEIWPIVWIVSLRILLGFRGSLTKILLFNKVKRYFIGIRRKIYWNFM